MYSNLNYDGKWNNGKTTTNFQRKKIPIEKRAARKCEEKRQKYEDRHRRQVLKLKIKKHNLCGKTIETIDKES